MVGAAERGGAVKILIGFILGVMAVVGIILKAGKDYADEICEKRRNETSD